LVRLLAAKGFEEGVLTCKRLRRRNQEDFTAGKLLTLRKLTSGVSPAG
jgi:hypothetical protein